MKKNILSAIMIAVVFMLCACSATHVPAPTSTQGQEAEQLSEVSPKPVATEAEPMPDPTPESTPNLNADPMNAVNTVLNDPQVLGGEDTTAMTENMGGMFGGIDVKQPSDDGNCFQFITGDGGAWMPYNTRLLDVGENRGDTQAFLIKFQPADLQNLQFNFIGMGEVAVSFGDGNQPSFVNVQEATKNPFSDFMSTELTLQSDKWYYGLFAFDTNGNFRSAIWEDGKAEEGALFEEKLGEQRDDYKESNWEVVISFDANGTLNVQSYLIMDFNGFTELQLF